jgi:DNA (cytosine-5)-methyltransferase 1
MPDFQSIELFSGAGGLALGLQDSGWYHVALVEQDKHACSTIRLNQMKGERHAAQWNLLEADVRDIYYSRYEGVIDMVAGGPPCQPFSLGGKHKGHLDVRNMFPEAVRVVRETKPKVFVFENVKGLLRQSFSKYFSYNLLQLTYPEVARKNGASWHDHLERLERHHTSGRVNGLQYRVIYRLLNAADYGVPQNRQRVFIVGFRSDLGTEWSFPKETHNMDRLLWDQWVSAEYWDVHKLAKSKRPEQPSRYKKRIEQLRNTYRGGSPLGKRYLTVRDALCGLPEPQSKSARITCKNHEFRDGARSYPGHTGSNLDEPAKTLKAGDHGVPGGENTLRLDGGGVRYFTVRESARLQAFPDDYEFSGSWTECMRQIGNAVPVTLAEVVGQSIMRQLSVRGGSRS